MSSSEKIQSIIGGPGYTATPIKDAPAHEVTCGPCYADWGLPHFA